MTHLKIYNLYFFYLLKAISTYQHQQMGQSATSQSQPSYFQRFVLEMDNKSFSKSTIQESFEKLVQKMKNVQGAQFQECLKELSLFFKQGYATEFIKHSAAMRNIMNHFSKLSKALEQQNHDFSVEYRMIYTLSVLAQLIRANPKLQFPFTRKFLTNLFLIDDECLTLSPHRKDILAILGVLFENLSRQTKLLEKYSMVDTLKKAILSSYALIDEIYTIKLFNKSIMNLVTKGVKFGIAEFHKHQVLETVCSLISITQLNIFLMKAKLAGLCIEQSLPNIDKTIMVPEL